jgi:hypothetical protein
VLADYKYPSDNSDLPAVEQAFARVIGRSAALRLSWKILHTNCQRGVLKTGALDKRFGDLYVPKTCSARFIAKVGDEIVAKKLVAEFGGEQFQLTGCRRAYKALHGHVVRKLGRYGARRADIVRASRFTARHVHRLIADEECNEQAQSEVIRNLLVGLSCLSFFLAADPL